MVCCLVEVQHFASQGLNFIHPFCGEVTAEVALGPVNDKIVHVGTGTNRDLDLVFATGPSRMTPSSHRREDDTFFLWCRSNGGVPGISIDNRRKLRGRVICRNHENSPIAANGQSARVSNEVTGK